MIVAQKNTQGAGLTPPVYTGLRVVEIADAVVGEQIGLLLAEYGAEVIKLEPPSGAPSRAVGPYLGDVADRERSLHFWYYNRNKNSVVLDPSQEDGRVELAALLSDTDVLVLALAPARLGDLGLDPAELAARYPRLIVVAATNFGLDGPWADFAASDLVSLAAGGPLHACGYDDHSTPPIRPGGEQAGHTAAAFGHLAVLLALLDRQRTGLGQVIDLATHDALAVTTEFANPYWVYQRLKVQRQTCRHALAVRTPPMHFRCNDGGYVHFNLLIADAKLWAALVGWMDQHGAAGELTAPEWLNAAYRQQHSQIIQDTVGRFFGGLDAAVAYHEGQRRRLPIGVINAPEDVLVDEQLAARRFFDKVVAEDGTSIVVPGAPFTMSGHAPVPVRRAPRLGEHG